MRLQFLMCFWLFAVSPTVWVAGADRQVARPLPDHPGNVFLSGEEVTLPVPAGVVQWRATDLDGELVSKV